MLMPMRKMEKDAEPMIRVGCGEGEPRTNAGYGGPGSGPAEDA